MDTAHLVSLVEHLEDNIDDLEDNLEPLLSTALTATTKKLPLLDKAKLYVLIVYSIESLLFSYLRLNGAKAKDHPVFNELARVKQYFAKLKVAEEGPTKPRENLSLNKQAAGRLVKHALGGNHKYDLERAEREAKEKLMAKRKLQALERKNNTQANASADNNRDYSQGSDGEEDGEIEETTTQPSQPAVSQPHVGQPSNGSSNAKKDKKDSKRSRVKAGKRAKKRKRERQDEGSQKSKKKNTGKGKNKQDRSPPADRKWI